MYSCHTTSQSPLASRRAAWPRPVSPRGGTMSHIIMQLTRNGHACAPRLKKFNKDILVKKDEKIYHDKKAFREVKAYKWDIFPKSAIRNRSANIITNTTSSRHSPTRGNVLSLTATQSQGSRRLKRSWQGNISMDSSSELEYTSSTHTMVNLLALNRTHKSKPTPHMVNQDLAPPLLHQLPQHHNVEIFQIS